MSEAASIGGDELSARVGELHRLTIMFCDVVGSTELSGRWEPEAYRELMASYHSACREVVESEFDGHIVQIKGDGILSVFGFPVAHENDAERAVRAGLALVRAVRNLSPREEAADPLDIRVAVHHGPLYVDFDEDDVYGLAANVGARLQAIAEPGTVVLSDEVRELVEDRFEIEPGDPQIVKGVATVSRLGRAPCPGPAFLGDTAGRAGCRAGAPAASLEAGFGRHQRARHRSASQRRRGRRQVPPRGRVRR